MEAIPWEIASVLVPLVGALLAFLAGRRATRPVGMAVACLSAVAAAGLVVRTALFGAYGHQMGGWGAPLGIELRVDGLSAIMIAMTGLVGLIVSVFAWSYFPASEEDDADEISRTTRLNTSQAFWPIWLICWASLDALYLSSDLFNLYVTIELVGLSAVALVALAGTNALAAATRYLLVTLVGSMLYLLGVAFLYSSFGTLDLGLLGARLEAGPVVWVSLATITAALVLKTALFPLHFWLPRAHAHAPAPVSAVLSSLVVTASFYLILRLWIEVFWEHIAIELANLLAILGAAAIVWGGVQALLQSKLKMLVAYSTVAQLGYLFVFLPAALQGGAAAFVGGVYFALSHACAKAALFLAAGCFERATGEGTIASLRGTGGVLRLNFFSFAIAGVSLMGLPPSGGFIAKWLITSAALQAEQWIIAGVIFLGGLLTAGYIFKVVQMAFVPAEDEPPETRPLSWSMQLAPLVLALVAIALGLLALEPLAFMQIGEPFPVATFGEGGP